jgi:uncharacterized protein YcaQ
MQNTTRRVDAATARRFLVTRHLLAPPRSIEGGTDGVMEVFRRLGSIQFDPLAVAGRNHDVVLQARVRDYDPAWTETLLYDRRALYETYNKSLNLVPTWELPWFRVTWDRHEIAHRSDTFERYAETMTHVLDRIRAEGPLASIEFERKAAVAWYWGPTGEVRAVLEALAEAGVLGLARRDGNRRYYDLVERLFPAELLSHRIGFRDQRRHQLLSRYRGGGLLGRGGPGELWVGMGKARPGPTDAPGMPVRAELRAELVASGELIQVEVEGVRGTRYIIASELPILDAAEGNATLPAPPSASFLAPLDPLIWTATCCGSSSTSTTSGRCTSPRPNGVGATSCCRCSSATASSGESSRALTGLRAPFASLGSGGSRASIHGQQTASSTPCGQPSATTCGLRALDRSSGRPSSLVSAGSLALLGRANPGPLCQIVGWRPSRRRARLRPRALGRLRQELPEPPRGEPFPVLVCWTRIHARHEVGRDLGMGGSVMNHRRNAHRMTAVLFAVGTLIAVSAPAAAHPVSHSGTVGVHYLADSKEYPGARCLYDSGGNLTGIRVRDPFVFSSSNDQDSTSVSWRFVVQTSGGGGPWTTLKKSAVQFGDARTDRPADFSPLSVSITADFEHTYRVLVKMFWYVGGKALSQVGSAVHRVDWYRYPLLGFCPWGA